MRLYKCHVLSFVEGATPALAHASQSVLKPIDDLQRTFLDEIGLTDANALLEHSLAPLAMRRDLCMLGILHGASLGTAPPQICKMFAGQRSTLRKYGINNRSVPHDRQLHDPIAPGHSPMIRRSIYGRIRVYNLLPHRALSADSVKCFQRALQQLAKGGTGNEP